MGWSHSSQVSPSVSHFERLSVTRTLPCPIRQFWSCCCFEQWLFSELGDKHYSKKYLYCLGSAEDSFNSNICPKPHQHSRFIVQGRHSCLPPRFPTSLHPFHSGPSQPHFPSHCTIPLTVMPIFNTSTTPKYTSQQPPDLYEDTPSLHPNYKLCPKCKAEECIFLWKGINTSPPFIMDNPVIHLLADLASHELLHDTSTPGSALKKFHTFCDTFSIPKVQWLPAVRGHSALFY